MNLTRKIILPIIFGIFGLVFTILAFSLIFEFFDFISDTIETARNTNPDQQFYIRNIAIAINEVNVGICYIVYIIFAVVYMIKSLFAIKKDDFNFKKLNVYTLILGILSLLMNIVSIIAFGVAFGFEHMRINAAPIVFAVLLIVVSIVALCLRNKIANSVATSISGLLIFIIAIYYLSKPLDDIGVFRYVMYLFIGILIIGICVLTIIIEARPEGVSKPQSSSESSTQNSSASDNKQEVENKPQNNTNYKNGYPPLSFKTANTKEKALLIVGVVAAIMGVIFAIILCVNQTGIWIWLIIALINFGIGITTFLLAFNSYKKRNTN